MAIKVYATTDAEVKKHWDEKVMRETQKMTYFNKFESKDGSSIIFAKDKLKNDKGDKITFVLTKKLNEEDYKEEGQTMTGNEQSLDSFTDSVELKRRRMAVAYEGGLSEQRVVFEISDESERALKEAFAGMLDQWYFTELYKGTPSKIFLINEPASVPTTTGAIPSGLTATMLLTPKAISYIKTGALTGWNRTQEPFKPIMIKGKPHMVLLTHPDALFDLKQNSQYEQYLREAERRGPENPLFEGSIAIIDGVVIHESDRCFISKKGGVGGNVPYVKALLLGQNALVKADGKREEIKMETRDYDEITGYCARIIRGVKRTTFDSKDWACAQILMARTAVSD